MMPLVGLVVLGLCVATGTTIYRRYGLVQAIVAVLGLVALALAFVVFVVGGMH